MRVVLASGSPRRQDMLRALGLVFDVASPNVDETPHAGEDPVVYVERLARAKAVAVRAEAEALVIAADTTVDVDGEILGKPVDDADARRMLHRLSGRTHHVHTGVAVHRLGTTISGVADTLVQFEPLSAAAIDWYIETGEPFDKAGAYALQGAGGVFVSKVTGSVSNVVGLPLTLLVRLLRQRGLDLFRLPAGH